MTAAQHIRYKWLVVMWIVIGVLAAVLLLAMTGRITGGGAWLP